MADLRPHRTDRRVLRAATVHTVDSPLLLRAEQAALQRQDAELEVLLSQAREQGRKAGVADTLAQGSLAVLRASAALDKLADIVAAQQDREVQATTSTVLELALEVARWVLRRELSEDGSTLLARLEEGLRALLPSPTTRISVSPADHALVSEWASARGRVGTTVVADCRLAAGDAVVVTDAGRAELTVGAAMRAAAETLGQHAESDLS